MAYDRMPMCRESLTHKNSIGEMEFYVTVGFYDHDPLRPGEVFVNVAKEGSTLGGICQAIALAISIGLHYGVPWEDYRKHMLGHRFDPSGAGLIEGLMYGSITHAIADTVDRILVERATRFQPSAAPVQSPTELIAESPDPSRVADGSD